MDKEEIQRTLSKWAHSGFSTSRAKLNTTGTQSPITGGGGNLLASGGNSPLHHLSIADFQIQLLKSASKKGGEKKEETK
jgi:hypothetical protein